MMSKQDLIQLNRPAPQVEELDGWKVVRELIPGRYFSAASDLDFEYIPNKTQHRPPRYIGGPLAVFAEKAFAEAFIRGTMNRVIFPCKYVRSKDRHLWICSDDGEDYVALKDELPEGTDFADEITILA